MKLPSQLFFGMLLLTLACSSQQSKECRVRQEASLIGQTISSYAEIDTSFIVGQFATLFTDDRFAVSFLTKHENDSVWYVFLTKRVNGGSMGQQLQILDTLTVHLSQYPKCELVLGACECPTDVDDCLPIAIYDRDVPVSQVQPLRAWLPDITEGKLLAVDPGLLRCESMQALTDEP